MKPLRSTDNRDVSDYEAYLLARIDALEMKVRELTASNCDLRQALNEELERDSSNNVNTTITP